ncbi:uncharacterized protein LY79DRAFT_677098 [Colletotrichum navitas]|uniref:Uncharacterized protein n=1 Tax=Colletotrichum navitas TaxID=681940 RepID=A0AAD8Q820_9PEZI|nr:uncharacterized protein LY79DRAFT_677098 [Colletotrichum navitas]KAK1596951.1 hypothetical protein LY79DRAFT_677098 [Colletotrichum navitas]
MVCLALVGPILRLLQKTSERGEQMAVSVQPTTMVSNGHRSTTYESTHTTACGTEGKELRHALSTHVQAKRPNQSDSCRFEEPGTDHQPPARRSISARDKRQYCPTTPPLLSAYSATARAPHSDGTPVADGSGTANLISHDLRPSDLACFLGSIAFSHSCTPVLRFRQ